MKRLTLVAIVVVVGFFVGFGSGLVENEPGFVHIPENKYYGFPLAWRMVNTATEDKVAYPLELFLDVLFGIGMIAIVVAVTVLTDRWVSNKNKQTR